MPTSFIQSLAMFTIFFCITLITINSQNFTSTTFTFPDIIIKYSKHQATSDSFVVTQGSNAYVYNLTTQSKIGYFSLPSNITIVEAQQKMVNNSKSIRVAFQASTTLFYNTDSNLTSLSSLILNNTLQKINLYNNCNEILSLFIGNNVYFNILNPILSYIPPTKTIPRITSDGKVLFLKNSCKILKYIKNLNQWVDSGVFGYFKNSSCNSSGFNDIQVTPNNKVITIGSPGIYIAELDFNNLSLIHSINISSYQYDGNCKIPYTTNDRIYCKVYNASGYYALCYNLINHTYTILDQLGTYPNSTSLVFYIINQQFITITRNYLTIVTMCPSGMYYSVNTFTCANCPSYCQKCTIQQCLICQNQSQLVTGQCILQILNSNFANTNTNNTINNNNSSTMIENNNCLNGFYYNMMNYKCVGCPMECKQCNDSITCTQLYSFYKVNQEGKAQIKLYLKIISQIFSFPTIRLILAKGSILFFLTDKLWFFQYHKKQYPQKIVEILENIRFIQFQKFQPIEIQRAKEKLQNYIKLDMLKFELYQNYSHPKYFQIERKDSTYVHNTIELYTEGVPVTLLVYFSMFLVFKLLQENKYSVYLRKYSLFWFIVLIIIEPNIQFFTFLGFSQMHSAAFYNDLIGKGLMILWIVGLYMVVLYCFAFYLMIYYHYDKLSKYYNDNCFRILPSFAWATFEIGIKNFLLGIVNSYLYYNYQAQILSILFIELVSLISTLYFFICYDIFLLKSALCMYILASAFFCLFCFTLLISGSKEQPVTQLFNTLSYLQVLIMSFCCLTYSLINIFVPLFIEKTNEPESIKGSMIIKNQPVKENQSLQRYQKDHHDKDQSKQPISQGKQQQENKKQIKQTWKTVIEEIIVEKSNKKIVNLNLPKRQKKVKFKIND